MLLELVSLGGFALDSAFGPLLLREEARAVMVVGQRSTFGGSGTAIKNLHFRGGVGETNSESERGIVNSSFRKLVGGP